MARNEGHPRHAHCSPQSVPWDYLGTQERRSVASEIGQHFSRGKVDRVVMIDVANEIVAIYWVGELVMLAPLEPEA